MGLKDWIAPFITHRLPAPSSSPTRTTRAGGGKTLRTGATELWSKLLTEAGLTSTPYPTPKSSPPTSASSSKTTGSSSSVVPESKLRKVGIDSNRTLQPVS